MTKFDIGYRQKWQQSILVKIMCLTLFDTAWLHSIHTQLFTNLVPVWLQIYSRTVYYLGQQQNYWPTDESYWCFLVTCPSTLFFISFISFIKTGNNHNNDFLILSIYYSWTEGKPLEIWRRGNLSCRCEAVKVLIDGLVVDILSWLAGGPHLTRSQGSQMVAEQDEMMMVWW